MITAAVYKMALVSLLIITGATSAGITYYYQLRTIDMSNQITNLTSQVSKANSQATNLTDQIKSLSSQVGQLEATNSQLNHQVQDLQTEMVQLNSLAQKQVTLVSEGQILLVGNGAVAYINFTVPSDTVTATLNVSFTGVEFGVTTRLSLLNTSQYYLLRTCNCVYYGNYSSIPTTWSSPWAHSYQAQVTVPSNGLWIMSFQKQPGSGSSENYDESIVLIRKTLGPLLTFLHGEADSSAAFGSVPIGIMFDTSYWNPDVPSLSSVVESLTLQDGSVVNHYQLYIVPGKTYTVSIFYRTTNGYGSCSATPSAFVPTGTDMTQTFTC
ncbi:hypothetical protein E6H33_07440 [Candidatus Bathyarchaeota archaeon]|nr:MAG: hypothetical protein E6H33_07440 [Candidatus Bathyarchaeota archaeon]